VRLVRRRSHLRVEAIQGGISVKLGSREPWGSLREKAAFVATLTDRRDEQECKGSQYILGQLRYRMRGVKNRKEKNRVSPINGSRGVKGSQVAPPENVGGKKGKKYTNAPTRHVPQLRIKRGKLRQRRTRLALVALSLNGKWGGG